MMRMGGLLMAALVALPASAETDAEKVQACMRANVPETVQVKTFEITARDRTGSERTLRGRLFGTKEGGRVRAMVRVEAPADLARAAYLVREGEKSDEMYVFVPSLNKTRRITGASMDGSLWGTDLSYADVKQLQNAFDGGTVKGEGEQKIEGRTVSVLAFTPRAEEQTRYNQIRSYIDAESCVPLKVEFIEGKEVRKQMTVLPKDLKKASGKHWYAEEAQMADIKDGTQTRIKVLGVTSDSKLASRYFNPQTFHIGS
jgi:hypothetical protein